MKDKKWVKVTYLLPDDEFGGTGETATTWVPLGVADENVSEYLEKTLNIHVIEWADADA